MKKNHKTSKVKTPFNRLTIKRNINVLNLKIMKNFLKVALATAAVIGIAKLATGECKKDGKCKNFKQKRLSFLDKVRNMSDEEFSKFKEDFTNGNFRQHWKHRQATESNS